MADIAAMQGFNPYRVFLFTVTDGDSGGADAIAMFQSLSGFLIHCN